MLLKQTVIVLALVSSANASELDTVQVGLAALIESSPYKGKKDETLISPLILFEYGRFSFDGEKLGYSLYKQNNLELQAVLAPSLLGYKSTDSQYLEGMKKRKNDVSAGVEVSYQLGLHAVNAKLVNDILNRHKGYELDLKYTTLLPLSRKSILMPYLGVEYSSKKKSNYYYGVTEKESTINRSSYTVGNTINPYIGIKTAYKINKKWSLSGKVEYQYLDKKISNSPIINKNNKSSIAMGVLYSW